MSLFSKQHCRIDKSSAFHTGDVPGTQSFLTPKVINHLINQVKMRKLFVTYFDVDTSFSVHILSFDCYGLRFIDKRCAQSLTGGLTITNNKLPKTLSKILSIMKYGFQQNQDWCYVRCR